MSLSDSNWINVRMRKLLARDFCPVCGLLPADHDDERCEQRYTKEESCLDPLVSQ